MSENNDNVNIATENENNKWTIIDEISYRLEDLVLFYPSVVWAWNFIICFFYICVTWTIADIVSVDNLDLATEIFVVMLIILLVGLVLFYCCCKDDDNEFKPSALIFPIFAFLIGILVIIILPPILNILGAAILTGICIIGDGVYDFASFIATPILCIN